MPELNWIGKSAVVKHHKEVPFRLLEPDPELSCGDPESGNLIVEGDNLHALKALLSRYAGKVKCIYIDPPYNTGKQGWIYNDKVNSPVIEKWLGETVGNEAEDLTRHDKWLCMMYPRLILLKQFLAEDGVIFISIDDNEVATLRMLMDEIFGRKNFISNFVWNTEGNTDNQFEVKVNHEHVLLYIRDHCCKSSAIGKVIDPNTREDSNLWKGIADNNINKNNRANPPAIFTIPEGFPCKEKELFYEAKKIDDHFFKITADEGMVSDETKTTYSIEPLSGLPVKLDDLVVQSNKVVKPCRVYGGFANRNKLEAFVQNGCLPIYDNGEELEFYLNANAGIRYTRRTKQSRNILSVLRNFGTTEQMRGELKRAGLDFSYPKPVKLLQYLLKIGTSEGPSIILDSFAGSGTIGEAVIKQNEEDGCGRKFILCQMAYESEEQKKKDQNIARDVTARRVRLAVEGYTDSKGKKVKGLGGGFQYCRLSTEPLFDAYGAIRDDVSFAQLAEFVWFVETGTGYSAPKKQSPLLGIHEGRAIYLLYNGILQDRSDLGGNVLNQRTLAYLESDFPHEGIKTIYGARCRYQPARLKAAQIEFKQLPYRISH